MKHLIREDIAAMQPYKPILPFEVRSRQLGRSPEEIVKLDANENPYGCSPAAIAALQEGKYFHVYPDPEARALREALSNYLNFPAERLVCGLGADELIDLVLRVVLSPSNVVVDCPPSFGMYPFSTVVNAGRYVTVPRDADFNLDVAAIEQTVAETEAKVLFLCSPNNPNGSVIDDTTLHSLLALPCLVVLDEAYVEFSMVNGHPSHLDWTLQYDNLVVLRTFSKLAGLAGMRIGYGAFPEWLIPHIMKIKQPYNVTVSADLMARGALEDPDWLSEKVNAIVAERNNMVTALEEFPFLQPYPSYANFVLFRVLDRDAGKLKLDLEQEGILVRYFAKPGVDNCIRISAGRPADTATLVTALRKLR